MFLLVLALVVQYREQGASTATSTSSVISSVRYVEGKITEMGQFGPLIIFALMFLSAFPIPVYKVRVCNMSTFVGIWLSVSTCVRLFLRACVNA